MTNNNRYINLGLLIKLLSIQSKSNDDAVMHKFLKDTLTTMKLTYEEDGYGNIYVTKGKAKSYPCIVAHTDTVHSIIEDSAYKVLKLGTTLYAMDAATGCQTGIGGDDKVGIFVALHALKYYKNVKVVLFRNEEIGHIGSTYSIKNNKEFYKDCNFVIECDRKGNADFITKSGGHDICSAEFIKATAPIVKEHRYKKTTGNSSDIDTLVSEGIGISCINLSSGYWRPHLDNEIVVIDDVEDVIKLVDDIVKKLGNTRFEFKYKKPAFNFSNYGTGTYNFGTFKLSKKLSTYDSRYRRIILRDSNILDVVVPRTPTYISPKTELMFVPKDITVPIKLSKDAKCVENSKIRHEIVYLMEEDIFFCLRCQKPVADLRVCKKFYKEMVIHDRGNKFVYDNMNNVWLKKEEAVWKTKQNTYIAKSVEYIWA